MYFRIINSDACAHQTFLLADLEAGEAVVIDPLATQRTLLGALLAERDLCLRWILRSHLHQDEGDEDAALCALSGATLVVGQQAPTRQACHRAVHGEQLPFGHELVQVLATPGHTSHCLCFLWRDRLFCGDALDFAGTCRHPMDGDFGQLYDSLTSRVFTLPDETLVFPTHMNKGRSVFTVAEERRRQGRLLSSSREAFMTELALKRQQLRETCGLHREH